MKYLIVGGTSGLGLELARGFSKQGNSVTVTGRRKCGEFETVRLDIDHTQNFISQIENGLVDAEFSALVYNAGYYQEGLIDHLTDDDIFTMLHVGLGACGVLVRRLLLQQGELAQFVAITSTSQFIPRKQEPVYTAVKAGLGQMAESLSLDERIEKTLVAAPAGMRTNFWSGTDKDTSEMLDPAWVAEQVIYQLEDAFRFRYVQIHRSPVPIEERVKVVRTRNE